LESGQLQQAGLLVKIDEHIEVAVRLCFAAGH
jgi:hypothetical protein